MTGATGALSAGASPVRRLFFALWPDDARARRSRRGRARTRARGRRPTPAARPMARDARVPGRRAGIEIAGRASTPVRRRAAAASDCESCSTGSQHWKRPQVLCLVAAGSTPEPLAALVHALRSELQLRGFTPEVRPFRAHVTLARRVPAAAASGGRLRWPLPWPVQARLTGAVADRPVEGPDTWSLRPGRPGTVSGRDRPGSRHEPAPSHEKLLIRMNLSPGGGVVAVE